MYDLIGDIHGHADELTRLLETLGYRHAQGAYRHPQRQVIFLGDFIDRGPKIRQVLELVRAMILEGQAQAVMGNHELNALAYHTSHPDQPGQFLRKNNQKNEHQHSQTLRQLKPAELAFYLDWFRTLPLWLELDGLRAVHACWDDQAIKTVTQGLDLHQGVTDDFLYSACLKANPLFVPVEILLKGKEISLPEGIGFQDREGARRTTVRTRWYLPAASQTYRSYALQSEEIECDLPLDSAHVEHFRPYPADSKPVFLGHYWLKAERPAPLAANIACLDYSIAKQGYLCAYRWQGEQQLTPEHFLWVPSLPRAG